MGYSNTSPIPGDNKIVLLKKILQAWGGAIPNGPLYERELLRLLLVRIGVTVPNGPHTSEELLALLLAAFQGGSPALCANLSGVDADPNGIHTATFVGQIFLSAAGEGSVWQATALGDSNWIDITPVAPPTPCDADLTIGPVSGTLSFMTLNGAQLDAFFSDQATEFTFSKVTEVTGNITGQGSGVTNINYPVLVEIGGTFNLADMGSLGQLLMPQLVTIGGDLLMQSGMGLVSFSLPNWIPTNGTTIDFTGCFLDSASVNGLLARCVSAGVTTCTIDFSGGNDAPTGQGIVDATALTVAGNTIATN